MYQRMKERGDLPNITATPSENDIKQWSATIKGPEGTPFENGTFKLQLIFPDNYPFRAPTVMFETQVYHPNIDEGGSICLDILEDGWTAGLKIPQLLLSLISLLDDPNADDPLRSDVAEEYRDDINQYNESVREHVRQYATV